MFYTIFAEKLKNMSEEKKNPDIEFEHMDVSEPLANCPIADNQDRPIVVDETPDLDFKDIDFGYPRTIKELNAALDFADAERNNPEKWVSSINFHQRLEEKYPWLR